MWNLPVQKRQSALRGCLHVESTIDSYGEVIDRFGLRLAVEPPSVLTSRLDTFADPPAELGTSIRPGLDLYAGPRERSAEAHRGFGGLASSTLRGAGTH